MSAFEKLALVNDPKMVGNSVVLSLQMWEIDTAADTLKGSSVWVLYMCSSKVETSRLAKAQPALIDWAVMFSIVLHA